MLRPASAHQPADPHRPHSPAWAHMADTKTGSHTGLLVAWPHRPAQASVGPMAADTMPIPKQAGVRVEHLLRFCTKWRAVALDHVVEEAEERVALRQRAALVAQPHAWVGAQPGGQRADSAPVSTSKVRSRASQSRRPGGRSAEAT